MNEESKKNAVNDENLGDVTGAGLGNVEKCESLDSSDCKSVSQNIKVKVGTVSGLSGENPGRDGSIHFPHI